MGDHVIPGIDTVEQSIVRRDGLLQEMRDIYYWHVHRINRGKHEPRWRGVQVVKFPSDLILYSEVIFANKPDWIIETGTRFGGSALFFADMMQLAGCKGKVITIDVTPQTKPFVHTKLEYICGSSSDRGTIGEVARKVAGGTVMAVLDSDHSKRHVQRELRLISPLVTKDQYVVVEDCYTKDAKPYGPGQAVEWFLGKTDKFTLEPMEDRFLFHVSRGGWLKRVR